MYSIKKRNRKWLYSPFTVIFLLVVLFFVWHGVWGVYQKERMSRSNVERLQEEKEQLTERKEDLEQKVESLQTDKGVVREVREKFDVVREGERVAILIDPKATTTEVVEEEPGFWKRVWGSLTGIF